VEFNENEYYDLLTRAVRMDDLIKDHWAVMGEFDRQHRVKLVVDEWGAWHKAGSEVAPHHLFGQIGTMRDAIIAGLTLDIFHRHAEKVAMANVAQLVNCIHSLFIAHEDKFLATPNYHVFDMYKAHKGAQTVRAVFAAPSREKLPGLDGSASLKDKQLVLTCTNTNLSAGMPVEVRIAGGAAKSAEALVLNAEKPQAHNSFAQPDQIKPRVLKAEVSGGSVRFEMPPASVVRVLAELA
jgi:alpha-N-arabinofuranosidase